MPPLTTQGALATPIAQLPIHNNVPPASNYPAWNNPPPHNFDKLDRNYVLQADNYKFLEMHPNGTRGVSNITKYCLLTIYILNITSFNTNASQVAPHLANWGQQKAPSRGRTLGEQTKPLKVFRSSTGNYLCMDNASVIFQQATYDPAYCLFHHDYDVKKYRDRYYRLSNSTNSKNNTRPTRWYVGINKDGTIRCGNVTRKKQRGANYYRIEISADQTSDSPPYELFKRKCCPKDKCKKRKNRRGNRKKDKPTGSAETTTQGKPNRDKSKRCYRNWCRRHRRQFFQLKLKDVNRYYNRCIKNKKEIRHCENR